MEFPDTHIEYTLNPAHSITRVLLSKNLTVTSNALVELYPRKGQRLKDLEYFLTVMRARYPSLQMRSDNEGALKHVLKDAYKQVHLEYSNTHLGLHPMVEVRMVFEP